MLAQVLGAELGAGTVMAPDEAEALEWACRVATDVVLLDLMPPPVHGCSVARELPADRRARSAAIVAISAMTPVEQVRTRVLEAGCDDFVARPFRIDDRPKTQRQASAAAEGVQHGGTIFWPEQGVAETADPIECFELLQVHRAIRSAAGRRIRWSRRRPRCGLILLPIVFRD